MSTDYYVDLTQKLKVRKSVQKCFRNLFVTIYLMNTWPFLKFIGCVPSYASPKNSSKTEDNYQIFHLN